MPARNGERLQKRDGAVDFGPLEWLGDDHIDEAYWRLLPGVMAHEVAELSAVFGEDGELAAKLLLRSWSAQAAPEILGAMRRERRLICKACSSGRFAKKSRTLIRFALDGMSSHQAPFSQHRETCEPRRRNLRGVLVWGSPSLVDDNRFVPGCNLLRVRLLSCARAYVSQR